MQGRALQKKKGNQSVPLTYCETETVFVLLSCFRQSRMTDSYRQRIGTGRVRPIFAEGKIAAILYGRKGRTYANDKWSGIQTDFGEAE